MLENVKSNSVFHGGTTERKEPFEEENNAGTERNVPLAREAGATSKIRTPEKEVFGC
jgi:hypothetical protein